MKTCPNDLVCHNQGECLRPTPETDEAQFGTGRVSVDFARRLERERNEAREENARLREVLQKSYESLTWAVDNMQPPFLFEPFVKANNTINQVYQILTP